MICRFNMVIQEKYRDSREKVKWDSSVSHYVGAIERSAWRWILCEVSRHYYRQWWAETSTDRYKERPLDTCGAGILILKTFYWNFLFASLMLDHVSGGLFVGSSERFEYLGSHVRKLATLAMILCDIRNIWILRMRYQWFKKRYRYHASRKFKQNLFCVLMLNKMRLFQY